MEVRVVMKVLSQVFTIPGGPENQAEISAVLLVQANRSTILSCLHTNLETVTGELHNGR